MLLYNCYKDRQATFYSNIAMVLLIILLAVDSFFGFSILFGQIASLLCILPVARLLYCSYRRKDHLMFVIFSFMIMYTWPIKLFFFDGLYFSPLCVGDSKFSTSFYMTIIFAFFFWVFIRYFNPHNYSDKELIHFHDNRVIYYCILIVTALLIYVFRPIGNAYDGSDPEASMSSVYEYLLVFFYLLYLYSGNKKLRIIYLYILAFVYSLFVVMSGGRVAIIELFLLLLSINLRKYIKFRYLVILLIIGFWIMNVFENIRSNPTEFLKGNIWEILNPFVSNKEKYQMSNAGDIVWASERIVLLTEDGILTLGDRLYSFFYFLLAPFDFLLPESDLANLATYRLDKYDTGGGVLGPVIIYIYSGFIGVFIIARFLAKCFNSHKKLSGSFYSYYVVFLITSTPRWFGYYPTQIVKYSLICAIFVVIINKIGKLIPK